MKMASQSETCRVAAGNWSCEDCWAVLHVDEPSGNERTEALYSGFVADVGRV